MCARYARATDGEYTFASVTLAEVNITLTGAMGDLSGDGIGGSLSDALAALQPNSIALIFTPQIPTTYIAGSMSAAQLAGLNNPPLLAQTIQFSCSDDPVANDLTVAGWPTIVSNQSDAIVPLTSQVNNATGITPAAAVHSPAPRTWASLHPVRSIPRRRILVARLICSTHQSPIRLSRRSGSTSAMSLTRRFKEALFAVAILAVMFTAAVAMGAAEPALQITSPAAGTTFNTGQTINVTVNVTALGSFKRFALIGERRLGAAAPQLASKTPLTFSLPIPANLQPGPYSLTAIGYGPNQTIIAESVVVVQIENSSALLDLITSSSALTFEAIGERLPLRIGGATPDGTPVDLTHSSHVSFASSDLTIGTVDNTGVVTAVGPGNATINVKLDSGGTAALPIHVLPPALLPSMRSIAFGNQTMGTTGKTTSFSVTNMLSYPLKILAVHSSPDFPGFRQLRFHFADSGWQQLHDKRRVHSAGSRCGDWLHQHYQ